MRCRRRGRFATAFEFDRVSFRYPGTARLVLDRLDFRFEPGERIALIGENGQGKTTHGQAAHPALRSHRGRILLDGSTCANTTWRICTARSASSSRTSCAMR